MQAAEQECEPELPPLRKKKRVTTSTVNHKVDTTIGMVTRLYYKFEKLSEVVEKMSKIFEQFNPKS